MKKLLAVVFLLALSASAVSQPRICGVQFGASYNETEKILLKKYGKKDRELSDEFSIVFREKSYAGYLWDMVSFYFLDEGSRKYFSRCSFTKKFNTSEKALKFQTELVKLMKKQYNNVSACGYEEGYKYYMGGKDPFGLSQYGFAIFVTKVTEGIYVAGIGFGPSDPGYEKE